jgi:hypothetical protein
VISSGRPERGIEGLWLRPMNGWPSGFYEGPPLLWTRLVVVSELPVARDTLLLRLLGAGRVLRQAIPELKALQAEAPERTLACRFATLTAGDPHRQYAWRAMQVRDGSLRPTFSAQAAGWSRSWMSCSTDAGSTGSGV